MGEWVNGRMGEWESNITLSISMIDLGEEETRGTRKTRRRREMGFGLGIRRFWIGLNLSSLKTFLV